MPGVSTTGARQFHFPKVQSLTSVQNTNTIPPATFPPPAHLFLMLLFLFVGA